MNYNQTPIEQYGFDKKDGLVALELEVEGIDLPRIETKLWKSHNDGSLKLGGMEYVHNGPQEIDKVYESLKNFEERIIKSGATVYSSERTSVHVHKNVQDRSIKKILQGAVAYYMLEPALMNLCGDKRKGNLFCLQMENAPGIMNFMQKFAEGRQSDLNPDTYRYASVNFGAIPKFGSIEIRTMRGVYDPDFLTMWAKGVSDLFDKAAEEKSPEEVFDSWYGRQPKEFLSKYFDDKTIDAVTSFKDWDQRLDRNHKILSGFVYDNDWNQEFKEEPKAVRSTADDLVSLWATNASLAPRVRTTPLPLAPQPTRLGNYTPVHDLYRIHAGTLADLCVERLKSWYQDIGMITWPEDMRDRALVAIEARYQSIDIMSDSSIRWKTGPGDRQHVLQSTAILTIADSLDQHYRFWTNREEPENLDEDDLW